MAKKSFRTANLTFVFFFRICL